MTSIDNNVTNLIAAVASRSPDRTALVFQKSGQIRSITFGQLWKTSQRVAANLKELGLQKNDRAIVMIPMSIELYQCLLGIVQMGAAAVFVDPWIANKQIARFAEFAEPTAYLGIGKSHLLRLFRQPLRRLELTVTTGRRFLGIPARHSLSRLLQSPKSDSPDPCAEMAAVSPDDSALITFTSGSSGDPKGANRTHGFLAAQHRALKTEFPYEDHDIDMPMFPVFALNNLVTGIPSIIPEMDFRKVAEVDGATVLDQIRNHQVSTCTASPPFIDRLAEASQAAKSPLPLRRILTGGAPVSDDQLAHWIEVFPQTEVVVAYGSTEAEPVGHISARQRISIRAEAGGFCTGRPTTQIDCRIIPIFKSGLPVDWQSMSPAEFDHRCLPAGTIGELVVCGDHVCQNYYRNEAATRRNKLRVGESLWHRMGDTGYFDATGNFWLTGRVHSTIERDGRQIHPQLVEQRVRRELPNLTRVASLGLPDDHLGQRHGLAIQAPEENTSDLHSALGQLAAEHDLPIDEYMLVDEFPLDPRHQSKIDYEALRQRVLQGDYERRVL